MTKAIAGLAALGPRRLRIVISYMRHDVVIYPCCAHPFCSLDCSCDCHVEDGEERGVRRLATSAD